MCRVWFGTVDIVYWRGLRVLIVGCSVSCTQASYSFSIISHSVYEEKNANKSNRSHLFLIFHFFSFYKICTAVHYFFARVATLLSFHKIWWTYTLGDAKNGAAQNKYDKRNKRRESLHCPSKLINMLYWLHSIYSSNNRLHFFFLART